MQFSYSIHPLFTRVLGNLDRDGTSFLHETQIILLCKVRTLGSYCECTRSRINRNSFKKNGIFCFILGCIHSYSVVSFYLLIKKTKFILSFFQNNITKFYLKYFLHDTFKKNFKKKVIRFMVPVNHFYVIYERKLF